MSHPAYQLDWNLIRTFTAVVSQGSLTAAASALSLTYPTVARHIASLEDDLQLTLFDRTSSGMIPTAAGARLAAAAQDMRAQALAFETASDALRTEPGGTVRLTLSDFLIPMAPALLRPLQDQVAQSCATVEIAPSPTLVNLLQHDADIALRHIRPTQADLICRRVGSVSLSLWAAPSYLQHHCEANAVTQNSPATDMPSLQFIDGISHANLQRGADRLGMPIAQERVNFKSDCVWSQLHAARCGWGVIVLPDYLGSSYDELQRVETETPIPPLELWLVARQDMREKPLHRAVFDTLATAVEALFGKTGDTRRPSIVSDVTPQGLPLDHRAQRQLAGQ